MKKPEYWDVFNEDRSRSGKIRLRGDKFEDGEYHLVIHVCVFNTKGELLIQQRQPFKQGWPNLWDFSMGGNAVQGEDAQTAAMREVREELGLDIDLTGVRPQFSVNFDHGFDDFFIVVKDVDLDSLRLQPEEVQAVKWADRSEVIRMLESGEFIPYYPALIGMIFDNVSINGKPRYGLHTRKE